MSKPIEILVQETLERLRDPQLKTTADVKAFYSDFVDAIWTYKCPSVMFDFYKQDIYICRENGANLDGLFAAVKDVAALQAAFPDIKIRIGSMVVVGNEEEGYQIWARTYFNGTNLGYSQYGAPTGKKLQGDSCMTLSMLKMERINGKWKIVSESTMYSDVVLRNAMGGK